MAQSDSVGLLRQDIAAQARTISAIVDDQHKMNQVLQTLVTDQAVRKERDKAITERFDKLDKGLEGIQSMGRYVLFAFISTLLAAVVTFIVKGGLNVPMS